MSRSPRDVPAAPQFCDRCYPSISIRLPNDVVITALHNAYSHRVEIVRNTADAIAAISDIVRTDAATSPRLPLHLFKDTASIAVEFSDATPAAIARFLRRLCDNEESVEIRDNFAGANAKYTRNMGNLMGVDLGHRVEAMSLLEHTTGEIA